MAIPPIPNEKRVGPIGYSPIADNKGSATAFFARQWLNLVGLVQDIIDLKDDSNTNAARITVLEETEIGGTAGQITPLPAPLSNGNITLELANTAVAPGTYGDATNAPQITVDQKGRVTGVINVPITGGGGGGGSSNARWYRGFGLLTNVCTATATGGSNGNPNEGLIGVPVNSFFWNAGSATKTLTFDFGASSVDVNVSGIFARQGTTASQGTWQLAWSDDNVTYNNVGSTFDYGGALTVLREIPNDFYARYWRCTLVSGSTSNAPFITQYGFNLRFEGDGGGGGGGGWTLISNTTISVAAANFDFISLGAYQDILVITNNITKTAAATTCIRCSVDNGATYFSGASDYQRILDSGGISTRADILLHDTALSSARGGVGILYAIGSAIAAKTFIGQSSGVGIFTASASPVNAIRVTTTSGTNMTAGTIQIFAR